MTGLREFCKAAGLTLAASIVLGTAPLAAQGIETVDPDAAYTGAIDGDIGPDAETIYSQPDGVTYSPTPAADAPAQPSVSDWSSTDVQSGAGTQIPADTAAEMPQPDSTTYAEDDLIGEAEGLFGKGAEGIANLIQKLLKEQGEPNAYIVGREASGAFVVGARYGSGTLHHKVEGERPVYWTGPSIGFDAGANAGNTFVLVYNLYDSEQLYERFPAGEGQVYVVGGMTASYLRKGDTVLIPIRVGAGLRLGINAGYMRFSKKQRWLPF